MAELNSNEKRRQTIIEKYGSWEAYLEQRYRSPENAEKRKRAASIAGKVSAQSEKAVRPFKNKELARKANLKSQEVRRKK